MPRPAIDYLNARRALRPASGGKVYSRKAKYAPEEKCPPLSQEELERRWKRAEEERAYIADQKQRFLAEIAADKIEIAAEHRGADIPRTFYWRARDMTMERLAAQSTIDAVMYSLRGGTAVLARDDVRSRLAVIDEPQLLEMIALLQKRDGRIAPRWSNDEIEKLMETWTACHG